MHGLQRDLKIGSQINPVMPVTDGDLEQRVMVFQYPVIAERRNDQRIVPSSQFGQGDQIEMIVVIVGKQDRVDLGKVIEVDSWCIDPFWTGPCYR